MVTICNWCNFFSENTISDEEEELEQSLIKDPRDDFELSGYLVDEQECITRPTFTETGTQTDAPSFECVMSTVEPILCRKDIANKQKLSRWEEHENFDEELKLIQTTKVICALDLLVQTFADKCRHPTCLLRTSVKYTLCGTSVLLNWQCSDGHTGKFCSSRKVNGAIASNLQTSAAILLSGNNFAKMERFADFLGLSFISKATFYRAQRLYIIPGVSEWWTWQQNCIISELNGKDVVIAGDGQCDSPGFSAKNLCYFIMEVATSYIIDLEVLDKREVEMKSVNMEKQALQIILVRLKNVLNLLELVTDASFSIKKLMSMLHCIY